jgi:3-phosphoshikimate 1-carboxyvinyltransferase
MDNIQEKKSKIVKPVNKPLSGSVKIPSDKSISHRAAIFGALTKGTVEISNFSQGADCRSTLKVLQQLGINVQEVSENKIIISNKSGFQESYDVLDAGNSGTTIRLMSGILASHGFYSVITGDESLKKRPMARIINPLKQMGANIWGRDNDTKAPISIKGTKLDGINYNSPIASAQVKTCLLLAGLFALGKTVITEPYRSRDHSEKMLSYLGANISVSENIVSIEKSELTPKNISIPGDISSAAFFLAAGAIVPDSEIIVINVGINPTRTGIIDVLKKMGANIEILNSENQCGEEVGDIRVRYSNLKGITIEGEIIPRLIDELPIIAVVATQAEGKTIIKNAEDLRNKESDRIKAICTELKKMGAEISETQDGFIVEGKTKLKGDCICECYHDHRLAMSEYVAGLVADAPLQINEFDWVNISFPEFAGLFERLKELNTDG